MKKIISLMISVIMAFTVATTATIAFAATVVSPETTQKTNTISGEVNGSPSNDVVYTKDNTNPSKITFTYNGDGTLTGWEFPGMTEGKDYRIYSTTGNSITVEVLDATKDVVANAIIEEKDETTTKKHSSSSTSPDTGVATGLSLALLGAGVAVISAAKKRNEQ